MINKPVATACVLILLAALVRVERFNTLSAGGRNASVQTGARNSKTQVAPDVPPVVSTRNEVAAPISSTSGSGGEFGPDSEINHPGHPSGRSGTVSAVSIRVASEIYHIRGRAILGISEHDKESIARLREAVRQVAKGFGDLAILIDMDGLITSYSPFLVYGNPRFDLTKQTETIYRSLGERDAKAANGAEPETGAHR